MLTLLALDVGTTETGWCLMDFETLHPEVFGKTENNELIGMIQRMPINYAVYEKFESFGMPIGQTTIDAIQWNGRFIQALKEIGVDADCVTRKDEKLILCQSMKANDATIKQALVDRFAYGQKNYGKGTKKDKGWFYGFRADVWSAYAVGVTWKEKKLEKE